MVEKRKIINDPVFGFITIPNGFIYKIVRHRYFQRLGRIAQLGLSSVVYPGANHTRLLHSLGAMHLMAEALRHLRQKGQAISQEEFDAALAAILLHDVGHGAFSHALENTLVSGISHERISLHLMRKIADEIEENLDLAIKIFCDEYPEKPFLHQLVSGQLDVDRMDYLRRDSFFTGVTEGIIGSARIMKMLCVHEGNLAVESKGIYSIENFLFARRFMYWQVYFHKASVAAEGMLINILRRAKELVQNEKEVFASPALDYFLRKNVDETVFFEDNLALENFISLDDSDILSAIKIWQKNPDKVLSTLSQAFVRRELFKTEISESSISSEKIENFSKKIMEKFSISSHEASYFSFSQLVSTETYNKEDAKILILSSENKVREITEASDILNVELLKRHSQKFYFCYFRM